MAIRKAPFEYDLDGRSRTRSRRVNAVSKNPKMLKVKIAGGEVIEMERPKIIRTRRLDSLTLNREVVRALGRLEARNRALVKRRGVEQLPLDLELA